MQLKKIKVYGKLRKFLGKSTFEAAVKTPQQAYNFLKANFAGIEKHMSNQLYMVKMGGRVISKEFFFSSGQGDIQIIPVAVGANFIADAFNFVVGNIVPIVTTALTGGLGTALLYTGLSLASELLTPSVPIGSSSVGDTDPSIRGSYNFAGIQNVSNSGVPIPILYGLVYSGSIIISAGTDTAQIVKSIT